MNAGLPRSTRRRRLLHFTGWPLGYSGKDDQRPPTDSDTIGKAKRIVIPQSPAERSCRALGWKLPEDLLDHVIPFNERHLKRLLAEYIRYYHVERTCCHSWFLESTTKLAHLRPVRPESPHDLKHTDTIYLFFVTS